MMQSDIFRASDSEGLVLRGRTFDYLNTTVLSSKLRDLLSQEEVLAAIREDEVALPTTAAREGYYDDRHLEYWLSGYRDIGKVDAATNISSRHKPRILDFGGASGRTIRHLRTFCPSGDLFLSDINARHVSLVRQMFGGSVTALRNYSTPSLPFPDRFFDCVVAFSVFTHLDSEDIGWLLELRRVTKKGGYLYVTVHDEATWEGLPDNFLGRVSLKNPDLAAYHEQHPKLDRKVAHVYSAAADCNCDVFVTQEYLKAHWFPLIGQSTIVPLAHEHQAAVVMRVDS